MLNLFLYLIAAGIIAGVFKFAMGLITLVIAAPLLALLGARGMDLDELLAKHPKKFVTYGVVLNTTIGVLYAIVIISVTGYWIAERGGNLRLYQVLSLFWGASLITRAESYFGTLFCSCVGTILLVYLTFGRYAPIIAWIVVAVASAMYSYGRIDVLKQQQRHQEF
jgi:hypothetical protein